MGAPLSRDLRERVVNAYLAGDESYPEVAKRFGIGEASVSRWLRLRRDTGSVEPRAHAGGRARRIDDDGVEFLKRIIDGKPDCTLAELALKYQEHREIKPALCVIWRELVRAGLTRKKR